MLDFRRSRVRSSIDIHAAKEGEFSLLHLDVIFYIHLIAKSENKKGKRQKKPFAYKNFPLA